MLFQMRKECVPGQCTTGIGGRQRVSSEQCVMCQVPVLFTYLVEQQPDQAAACCESLFTGLALYLPFDILSCCESLYSNRRHNLCVSRQVGARATCHPSVLLLVCVHARTVCAIL